MVLNLRWASLVATFFAGGCLGALEYPCESITQCTVDGKDGTCHPSGWCAYPDDACESGQRFGPAAGDGLAGDCVGVDSEGGSASASETSAGETTTDGTTAGASTTTSGCQCSDPPGPCFEPEGACDPVSGDCVYSPVSTDTPCRAEDPCTLLAACDGEGACVAVENEPCDEPPECHVSPGTCDATDGSCDYEPLPDGTECTSDDPCQVGACMAGVCTFSPLSDGTSCGVNAADRCCAGACVDISADAGNCGGCGAVCQSDEICESIAVTTQCDPHPAATTGRCTCNGENADCPHGQICVTVAPVTDRCAPENGADCPGGAFHDVPSCPNYCE